MSVRAFLMLALVTALALSGCTASNGPNGQSLEGGGEGTATLSYNGASSGSHEKSASCDGSGRVNFNTNIGSGEITVEVRAGGTTIFSEDVGGPGQKSATRDVSGPSGPWTLKVTRSDGMFGGYSGQYNVNLEC